MRWDRSGPEEDRVSEDREETTGLQGYREPGEAKGIRAFLDFLVLLGIVARRATGVPSASTVRRESRVRRAPRERQERPETWEIKENQERKDRQDRQERREIRDQRAAEDNRARRASRANRDHEACRVTWECRACRGLRDQRENLRRTRTSNRSA